jgi:uncharacterized protein (TIGR03435 family)
MHSVARDCSILAITLALRIALVLTVARADAAGPPQFTAASLKLAADQSGFQTRPTRSVGRFRWSTDLLYMLTYAYHMESWRISETPGLNRIYTLEATTPANTTQDQARLMLQSLLIERFQLVAHRTIKVVDGYALTVAKRDFTLQQTKFKPENESGEFDDGFVIGILPDSETLLLRGHRASILQLADYMQRDLEIPIVDRTNLREKYDFELTCGRDTAHSPGFWGTCLEGAGLAIRKYRGPVEFLVIDRLGSLVEN